MTTETAQTDRVTLVDLMDELIPPPEPAPISLVPQTAGWLVLAVLVLGGAAALTVFLVRRHRSNAYRRAALAELSAAGSNPEAVAQVLRQTALSGFPRVEVASLQGDDWLAFLDRTSGLTGFRDGPGRFLATAPYKANQPVTQDGIDLARRWIRTHRSGAAA